MKMKAGQHTPTPWRIGAAPGFKDSDFPTNVISEKGAALADTNRNVHLTMEEKIANAAFIVKAVNSHEGLLDTLIMALPYIETALEDPGYKPSAVNLIIKQIREAIAQAEK